MSRAMIQRPSTCCGASSQCGGFTLVELVVTSGSVAVLAFALMSCLLIAGRALDEDRMGGAGRLKTVGPLESLVGDVRDAVCFAERTPNAVTFQVPDRNGDEMPETIRYSWSSTPGASLLMQYNGGAPAVVAPDVYSFNLAYRLRTMTGTGFAQGALYADEVLLALHENAPGGHFSAVGIMSSQWHALYFEPNLPEGTTQWDLTQICLSMKRSSNPDGYIAIQIRPPAEGPELRPSDTVLEEIVIHESVLGLIYDWHDFDYSGVTGLSPDEGIFVVVRLVVTGTVVALIQTEVGIDDRSGMAMYKTEDAGANWQLLDGEMLFRAFGVAHQ